MLKEIIKINIQTKIIEMQIKIIDCINEHRVTWLFNKHLPN